MIAEGLVGGTRSYRRDGHSDLARTRLPILLTLERRRRLLAYPRRRQQLWLVATQQHVSTKTHQRIPPNAITGEMKHSLKAVASLQAMKMREYQRLAKTVFQCL